jgi:signal transduction histidine kinase
MLKKLRLRLTLLYLFSAIALALVVAGGTYSLVNYYFQTTNDQALKVKMGLQFASLNIPLPVDLYDAVRQAGLVITKAPPTATINPSQTVQTVVTPIPHESESHEEGLQESELADIYVLPLTLQGDLISGTTAQLSTSSINIDAVVSAVKNGHDFRTVVTADNIAVRILTYRVPNSDIVEVFQVGRYLSAQRQVLRQLLNTMSLLGGLISILFGAASWVLAGRTIKPSQQAWDKQQAFIANASHELRAPLTLIHAGVELGLRKAESSAQRELLSDVLSDTNYMNKLIEELLLLSRLDAHALKLNLQPVKMVEFIPEILRHVERLADAKQISITQKVEDIQMLADPLRLKQLLLIILDNAIRNNQAGGVVTVEILNVNGNGKIKIADTGTGIPSEHLDKIFDRFYKLGDDQSASEYSGSGLGLSIAKGLIEAQKGKITINSTPGKGTLVTLIFPLAP